MPRPSAKDTAVPDLGAVSFDRLDGMPLESFDLLGREKLQDRNTKPEKALGLNYAEIKPNNFVYKSLSHWAYNISIGCRHACRFCYVSTTQRSRPGEGEEAGKGPVGKILSRFGVKDPEVEWGNYALFRPWDENKFLASLKRAEETPWDEVKPDSNRAILLCSTTDPYQTVAVPGNPAKTRLLNQQARFLVRRALELSLEKSTLNVRILTRSPLAKQDFDLYRRFGNRLLFGMSLPTLNDQLARIYEPRAPAPSQRLATLQAARDAGVHLYVAIAPTYPECDEADLRRTLTAVKQLNPQTIFHEPINIRGHNVERIAKYAQELGVAVNTAVFDQAGPKWRQYAVDQLLLVQKLATESGLLDRLHLWPDKALRSRAKYLEARRAAYDSKNPGARETRHQRTERLKTDNHDFEPYLKWRDHWHHRVSEWPGKTTL